MKEIYFVRHAVPENDAVSFRFSGFVLDMLGEQDHPLSEKGRGQAEKVAPGLKALGVERLVASTMRRATETAQVIAGAADIPLDQKHLFHDLVEIAPGRMSLRLERLIRYFISPERPRPLRRTASAIFGPLLGLYYFVQWYRGRTHEGDDVAAVRARLDRMFEFLASRPEERIAVVCHGFLVLFLIRELTGGWLRSFSLFESPIENCSVTRIDLDDEGNRRPVYAARMI